MNYMALREWPRAILFLEAILTAPTKSNASQIQVEAYKKWLLANLLARGEVVSPPKSQKKNLEPPFADVIQPGSLPKTTSPQVAKQVRTLGKPYEALGEVFKDSLAKEIDVRRLNAEVHNGNHRWVAVGSQRAKIFRRVVDNRTG